MTTAVQVILISGDKFEFRNVVELVFENDLVYVRGRAGGEEMTRAIFRKELVKCVLQSPDDRD